MGIVLIATSVPRVVFLLLGGVIADRLPRRLVMLWADAGRALAVGAIAVLGYTNTLQFWQLIALGLLFGLSQAFFLPAYQSIAPQLVEVEALPSANALNGLTREIGMLAGPALGALLVASFSTASAFAFDALTFLVSALCLLAIRVPRLSRCLPRKGSKRIPQNGVGYEVSSPTSAKESASRRLVVAMGDHRHRGLWQCLARAL